MNESHLRTKSVPALPDTLDAADLVSSLRLVPTQTAVETKTPWFRSRGSETAGLCQSI